MMLFIQIWNDLLQQIIYINSMSKFTFAIALTNFTGSFGTNWPVALAATFMTILPGIVIYIFGQKSFVEGIVLTGMKKLNYINKYFQAGGGPACTKFKMRM